MHFNFKHHRFKNVLYVGKIYLISRKIWQKWDDWNKYKLQQPYKIFLLLENSKNTIEEICFFFVILECKAKLYQKKSKRFYQVSKPSNEGLPSCYNLSCVRNLIIFSFLYSKLQPKFAIKQHCHSSLELMQEKLSKSPYIQSIWAQNCCITCRLCNLSSTKRSRALNEQFSTTHCSKPVSRLLKLISSLFSIDKFISQRQRKTHYKTPDLSKSLKLFFSWDLDLFLLFFPVKWKKYYYFKHQFKLHIMKLLIAIILWFSIVLFK